MYSDSGISDVSASFNSSISDRGTRVRSPLLLQRVISSGVCSTDQAGQDAPAFGCNIVDLIFLANDPCRVHQADEQVVAILPVGVGQVGADHPSFTMQTMACRASIAKEQPSARGISTAGTQVVIETPDLCEPLFARRAPCDAPVFANQRSQSGITKDLNAARADRA